MRALSAALVFAVLAPVCTQAAAKPDSATIESSGTVDTVGYRMTVWSNGKLTVREANVSQSVNVGAAAAQKFLEDTRAAQRSHGRALTPCEKNAPFSSQLFVSYHGWRSSDLHCPTTGALALLYADVRVMTATLQAQQLSSPIPHS